MDHDSRDVDAIFRRAMELAPDDRDEFLSERCAEDAQLRSAVEARLRDHVERELGQDSTLPLSLSRPKLIPDQLGPYHVIERIGAGGMGVVYKARDARLDREVAIKLLPDVVASSPARLARLQREARTMAAINHPNIIVLHSIETIDGIQFLTMELVDGQSLDCLIPPSGFPLSRVLDLAIPMMDALAAAHERGVIHRDLKPSNVMVTSDGRVKILDFGLAKVASPGSTPGASPRTATTEGPGPSGGSIVGTVPYMSPEQIRGEATDARSDLFSFGIMLYELATGRLPFAGATSAEVFAAILQDDPAPFASGRADPLRDLDAIVGRCLEKDPRDRPESASLVRNELASLKQGLDDWAVTYDLHVPDRDDFPFLGYEAALTRVAEVAAPKLPCAILDLGVGTGNLAKRLYGRGCEVWGLDVSPRMLARAARKLPGAHLAEADLLGDWPPAFHRQFDLIVSAYAFHHFAFDRKLSLLQRLVREQLAPHGRIIIADLSFRSAEALTNARDKWRDRWDDEHYWIAEEALPALESAGLWARYDQISEVAGVYDLAAQPHP